MKAIKRNLLSSGLILILILLFSGTASAAGELRIFSESGQSFLFKPKPGEVKKDKFFVRNLSKDNSVRVKIYPKDAITTSDGRFDLLREDQQSKHIGTWLKLSPQYLTLKPGETVEVAFSLEMPERIEPGQYIGGILAQGEPITGKKNQEGVNFQVIPRTGIFVTVVAPGEQIKLLKINSFKGKVNSFSSQAKFSFIAANTGNMTLGTKGYLDLKDSNGRTIKKVNVEIGFLLPGQKVTKEIVIDKITHIGAAKAHLVLNYADGKVHKATVGLLFVPVKLLSIILGPVIFLLIMGYILKNKLDIQIRRKELSCQKPISQEDKSQGQ